MNNELKTIHDFLMQIEVKGDSAIYLAESLVSIRRVIQESETSTDEPQTTELS